LYSLRPILSLRPDPWQERQIRNARPDGERRFAVPSQRRQARYGQSQQPTV
jgi:hypothetical protein